MIIKNDSGVKRKSCKKGNSKNVNINNDKDKDNLIDKLLNNKDKLHNFIDKVLNNLTNIFKLKEKILINKKKVEEINIPIKDIRLKLDKYKLYELNILYDDLVNHVWRMIYGKNRVNNEIDNIDCDIVDDAKTYFTKYIKVVKLETKKKDIEKKDIEKKILKRKVPKGKILQKNISKR